MKAITWKYIKPDSLRITPHLNKNIKCSRCVARLVSPDIDQRHPAEQEGEIGRGIECPKIHFRKSWLWIYSINHKQVYDEG